MGANLLNVRTSGLLVLIAGWSFACGAVSCLLTLIAWKRRLWRRSWRDR
jgi:hypothetical protein